MTSSLLDPSRLSRLAGMTLLAGLATCLSAQTPVQSHVVARFRVTPAPLLGSGAPAAPDPRLRAAILEEDETTAEGGARPMMFNGAPVAATRTAWFRQAEAVPVARPSDNAAAWENVYQWMRGPQPAGAELLYAEPGVIATGERESPGPARAPVNAAPGGAARPAAGEAKVVVGADKLTAWPKGTGALWHLGDDFSQLEAAWREVKTRTTTPRRPAVVAILDTQFDWNHVLLRQLNVVAKLKVEDAGGLFGGESHGTATLSLLAGQPTEITGSDGDSLGTFHGANPDARIIAVSGYTGVAHVFDADKLAQGISMALAVTPAPEVISASHGGVPSQLVKTAVDRAYLNGVTVVTAAGNYFAFPFVPVQSPTYLVFPAAYDDVLAVTGMTADHTAYRVAPNWWGWLCRHSGWNMRGNAGPGRIMDRAIAAYTPNVVWARYGGDAGPNNVVDLDGQGTSAATPQAAGAASLWVEYHREKIHAIAGTDKWKRAELVIQAMLRSAGPPNRDRKSWYYGEGSLKAYDALRTEPDPAWLSAPQTANRGPSLLLLLLSGFIHELPGSSRPASPMGAPAATVTPVQASRAKLLEAIQETFAPVAAAGPGAPMAAVPSDAVFNALNTETEQQLYLDRELAEILYWAQRPPSGAAAEVVRSGVLDSKSGLSADKARAALQRVLSKASPTYRRVVSSAIDKVKAAKL